MSFRDSMFSGTMVASSDKKNWSLCRTCYEYDWTEEKDADYVCSYCTVGRSVVVWDPVHDLGESLETVCVVAFTQPLPHTRQRIEESFDPFYSVATHDGAKKGYELYTSPSGRNVTVAVADSKVTQLKQMDGVIRFSRSISSDTPDLIRVVILGTDCEDDSHRSRWLRYASKSCHAAEDFKTEIYCCIRPGELGGRLIDDPVLLDIARGDFECGMETDR
jgi:hypothetical protein